MKMRNSRNNEQLFSVSLHERKWICGAKDRYRRDQDAQYRSVCGRVKKIIEKLDKRKAMGPDGVPNWILKKMQ